MAYPIALDNLMASNLLSKSAPFFTVRAFGEDDENDDPTLRARFGRSAPHRRDGSLSDVLSDLVITSSRDRSVPTTRETVEALHIRLEMPGLSKEDVTVTVKKNTLVIKGEAKKGPEEEVEFASGKFESQLCLAGKKYKIKEVKAEMKNGVLYLVVPKVVKEVDEASADVIKVNVD